MKINISRQDNPSFQKAQLSLTHKHKPVKHTDITIVELTEIKHFDYRNSLKILLRLTSRARHHITLRLTKDKNLCSVSYQI